MKNKKHTHLLRMGNKTKIKQKGEYCYNNVVASFSMYKRLFSVLGRFDPGRFDVGRYDPGRFFLAVVSTPVVSTAIFWSPWSGFL